MISEFVPGFKRIQDFVPVTAGETQDKMFFQVKSANSSSREQPAAITCMEGRMDLCSRKQCSDKSEDEKQRSQDGVTVVRQLGGSQCEFTNDVDEASAVDCRINSSSQKRVSVNHEIPLQEVEDKEKDLEFNVFERRRTLKTSRQGDGRPSGTLSFIRLVDGKSAQFGSEDKAEESGEETERRDIISMGVPRKPRSKRSTTVIRIPGFTFQRLPELLSVDNKEAEQSEATVPPAQSEEAREDTQSVDVAPKIKNQSVPKRIAVSGEESKELDDTDRRFNIRSLRRKRTSNSVRAIGDLYQAEQSSPRASSERQKRKRNFKKETIVKQRRMRKCATSPKASSRKRSLKTIIEECVRQQQTNTVQEKTNKNNKNRQAEIPRQHKIVKAVRHESVKKVDEVPLDFEQEDWTCPTVAFLLTNKLITVGDFVELISKEADPIFHGWFTTRGILCSNCAMVHSCIEFGACGNYSGTVDSLCVKDGISISQLMDRQKGVDSQQ